MGGTEMVWMRSIAVPALVLALASGLVCTMMRIHDVTFEVQELRNRVSRSDSGGPRLPTTTTVVHLPASPSSEKDLSADIARLEAEIEALRSALGIVPAEGLGDVAELPDLQRFVPGPSAAGAVVVQPGDAPVVLSKMTPQQQEQFEKAVLKVIADKNREDAQKQRLQMTNKVVDDLAKTLGLAGPQVDRAKQILADGMAKVAEMRRLMNDSNAKQVQKDISDVWKSMDQGIRAILTSEQVLQYDTWRSTKIAKKYFGPPASTQKPAPRPAKPGNEKRG